MHYHFHSDARVLRIDSQRCHRTTSDIDVGTIGPDDPFPQVSPSSLQMAHLPSVVRGAHRERVRSALYRAYRVESFVEGIGRDDTLDAVAWP